MRNHKHQFLLRLNDKEYKKLMSGVSKTNLPISTYIRLLIDGYEPEGPPPVGYFKLIEHLSYVGNNLNQIAKKAHILNVIDVQKYDEAVLEYHNVLKELTDAMISPRKRMWDVKGDESR